MLKSFQPTWQRRSYAAPWPFSGIRNPDFLRLFASQGVYWMHARRASYLLNHGSVAITTTRTAHYGSPADVDAVRESVEPVGGPQAGWAGSRSDVGDGRGLFGERFCAGRGCPSCRDYRQSLSYLSHEN